MGRVLNGLELGLGDGHQIDLQKSMGFLVLIHTFLIHRVAHFFDPVAEFMIKLMMDDGVRCVRKIDTCHWQVDRGTDAQ